MRDDLRDDVIDVFGESGCDLGGRRDPGDVKKGVHSVGVQRQSADRGLRRRTEQVRVFDLRRTTRRRSRSTVPSPAQRGGSPSAEKRWNPRKRDFATKPAPATLIDRAVHAAVSARGVAVTKSTAHEALQL